MKRSPLKRTGELKRSSLARTGRVNPVNRTRKNKLREECFGKQAQLCRESECCVPSCGWIPYEGHPTHPHHWPTVARGGKDSDTSPLCWFHHQCFHEQGCRSFGETLVVDVIEVSRLLAEQLKESE